jgi:hypothetical protein
MSKHSFLEQLDHTTHGAPPSLQVAASMEWRGGGPTPTPVQKRKNIYNLLADYSDQRTGVMFCLLGAYALFILKYNITHFKKIN